MDWETKARVNKVKLKVGSVTHMISTSNGAPEAGSSRRVKHNAQVLISQSGLFCVNAQFFTNRMDNKSELPYCSDFELKNGHEVFNDSNNDK